jgi:hypothetical protein
VENEFPGNRKAAPIKPSTTEKKLNPVEVGRVVRRKPPMGQRFARLFVAGDSKTVGQYVFMDVFLPAAKDLVTDMVSQGFERLIFGGERTPTRRPGASSYVSYNRFASSNTSSVRPGPPRDIQPTRSVRPPTRPADVIDDIVLESRHEAEEVLASMNDALIRYESVSVADLLDLVGEDRNFTQEKWGWTSLEGAGVSRTRAGYLLNLPRPVEID